MKKKEKYISIIILIIFCFPWSYSCKKDPQDKFLNEVKIYTKEKHTNLGTALLESVSIKEFESTSTLKNSGSLYRQEKNQIIILFPVSKSLTVKDEINVKYCAINDAYTILTDFNRLLIYDTKGNITKDFVIGESGKRVQSLYIIKNIIYYIIEFQLYTYDIENDVKKLFIEEKFVPSYAKYYKVYLSADSENLGILSGMAGSYNFDAVNVNTKSVLIKKLALSSSKFAMTNGNLYHIKGGSGEWTLEKMNLLNKTNQLISRFNDVTDLELMVPGLIMQNKNGLSLINYSGESYKIPFNFEIKGKFGDTIIIHFNNRSYLVNYDGLFEKIKFLKMNLPEIFN